MSCLIRLLRYCDDWHKEADVKAQSQRESPVNVDVEFDKLKKEKGKAWLKVIQVGVLDDDDGMPSDMHRKAQDTDDDDDDDDEEEGGSSVEEQGKAVVDKAIVNADIDKQQQIDAYHLRHHIIMRTRLLN
eukprot:SAG25_NODE_1645_length_2626_cov_42.107638_2_plen_130_part_00